ncbi:dipicolinate synthase subunit A [Gracilibacillus halophilus YIM-C55.5]|uniref:Dipicolinate synthase subunit A n=1 Tax=Gracilibacillus halophilus YIM-C55.5 TaxID=1308866 RepID=N4W8E3_9BACI|nr:dipicolinic acid synthetase subunit A [Gracilibacillus halophilus]ENH96538.1 dipicolinate synthase subunit A [Gracilibacillus halophilus YIM-C55.5]
MRNKKKIAIIGGDARYLPLIHTLNKNDSVDLELIGFDQVEQSYTGVKQLRINELRLETLDAVILPITGIDDQGIVETVFSKETIYLTKDWFDQLPKHCEVFTGIANQTLIQYTSASQLSLNKLMERDDVAIYNSIPTAEGAVMLAIQHTDITIHQSNVYVFGMGRVGETCATVFSGLGANVSVISTDEKDLARAFERGWTSYHLNDVHKYINQCDVLINTIPAHVVDISIIQEMQAHAIIIDLASKPGGIDFDYAKTRGIHAIHALGLPGLVAPKTAGEILAHCIEKIIFSS